MISPANRPCPGSVPGLRATAHGVFRTDRVRFWSFDPTRMPGARMPSGWRHPAPYSVYRGAGVALPHASAGPVKGGVGLRDRRMAGPLVFMVPPFISNGIFILSIWYLDLIKMVIRNGANGIFIWYKSWYQMQFAGVVGPLAARQAWSTAGRVGYLRVMLAVRATSSTVRSSLNSVARVLKRSAESRKACTTTGSNCRPASSAIMFWARSWQIACL